VQSFNRAVVFVTDSIQAIMQQLQGVVTYTLPVKAFATGIKNFDQWKSSLIAYRSVLRLLIAWFYNESAVLLTTPLMN